MNDIRAKFEEIWPVPDGIEWRIDGYYPISGGRITVEIIEKCLRNAAVKVIEMNRQHAEDQYGDSDKAESWSCVTVLRDAMGQGEKP